MTVVLKTDRHYHPRDDHHHGNDAKVMMRMMRKDDEEDNDDDDCYHHDYFSRRRANGFGIDVLSSEETKGLITVGYSCCSITNN